MSHTQPHNLTMLSPHGQQGGWGSLLERLPRSPAVYAWFRHIAISAALPPEVFAREVELLATSSAAPVHSAALGPFHSVRLWQRGALRPNRSEYLREIAGSASRRVYLASILRSATSLQAPLYVGKAISLRQRIEQHLAPTSDLAVRLRDEAAIQVRDCELVYAEIQSDPDDDEFLRFVEEIITYVCRPGFVIRPG